MENPIKMDDLEVPLFLETPISIHNLSNITGFETEKTSRHPIKIGLTSNLTEWNLFETRLK